MVEVVGVSLIFTFYRNDSAFSTRNVFQAWYNSSTRFLQVLGSLAGTITSLLLPISLYIRSRPVVVVGSGSRWVLGCMGECQNSVDTYWKMGIALSWRGGP